MSAYVNPNDNDLNVVAMWLKVDKTRWIAGVMAGILAGVMALIVAGILASASGREFFYPIKLIASIPLGAQATAIGAGFGSFITGLVFFELLAVFFGIIYAHFTVTNNAQALLGVGLTWGLFSWIFLWNLYMQSFSTIFAAALPSGAAFLVCLVYGLSLTSVAFFDRMLRGSR